MKNTISDIAKELKTLTFRFPRLGLRNGLAGISLFFFYYSRLTGDERYKELAKYDLERVVGYAPFCMDYYFASEFADIGRTIELLTREKFLDVKEEEITLYFEKPLMCRLRDDLGLDFGFCKGITGICDFFLNKTNNQEALDITFEHIYRGLNVKGYLKHCIDPLLLFPSDILRDVKIFFLKLEKNNIFIPDKKWLDKAIRKFESKEIPTGNCREYSVLQDLREAVIMENQRQIQSSLENIVANSSNLIFKGLAVLSLEDNLLPVWCRLV